MNDQQRLRLRTIAQAHEQRAARARNEPTPDAAFLAAFVRVRDGVLRPGMAEVGAQLEALGHGFGISPGGAEGAPSVDLHVLVAEERGDSKDTIRFAARKEVEHGWQVIAEVELAHAPIELGRFATAAELTRDVVEEILVDGVERLFAPTVESASTPAPEAPETTATAAVPSEPAEAKPGEERAAASEPPAEASPWVAHPAESLGRTSFALDVPRGPNLPFAKSPGGATSEPSPWVARPAGNLGATSFALDVPRGPDLPFAKSRASEWPGAEPAAASSLAGKADADLSAIAATARRGALPFAPAPSSPPPVPSSPPPADAAERAGGASLAETANMDLSAIVAAIKRGSLPFPGPEPASPPAAEASGEPDFALLPLETYASLSGALARGEPRADALARHRVSPEVFDRLAKAWAQRFQREPHLLALFKQLARSGAASPRRGD